MPEFTKVNIPYTSDMEIAVNPIYYVVENYGNNILPEVIATFLSFRDACTFVHAQKSRYSWLTYDIRRFSNDEVVPVGASED